MDKNLLSRPLLSCGLIIPHLCSCPPTSGITFYLLKFRNTIQIYIGHVISTLCINKTRDYSGDVTIVPKSSFPFVSALGSLEPERTRAYQNHVLLVELFMLVEQY